MEYTNAERVERPIQQPPDRSNNVAAEYPSFRENAVQITGWRHRRDKKVVGMKNILESTRGSDGGDYVWKCRRGSIAEHEAFVLTNHETRRFVVSFLDIVAALKVFLFFLVTFTSILVCVITAGLTVYWYYYTDDQDSFETRAMDWILLGFAVVTPMTVTIQLAFQRRERALINIARVRSFAYQIYLAHCLWNWQGNTGRDSSEVDWLQHTDNVLSELVGIGDELSRFLSLPTTSLSRHRMTRSGRNEAARTIELAYRLFDSLCTDRMMKLSQFTEVLKSSGLSATECARLRQYDRFMGEALEDLRMIKSYRTPEALRSFARLFTILLPPFYAPTYAQLAFDIDNLGIGIAFGIITALGLTALYEGIQVLEDPFVAFLTLEGIDVREEFEVLHWHQLVKARKRIYPHAPQYSDVNVAREEVESAISFGSNEEEQAIMNDSEHRAIDIFACEEELPAPEEVSQEDQDVFPKDTPRDTRTSAYARDLVMPTTRLSHGIRRRMNSEHGGGHLGWNVRGRRGHGRASRSLDG